MDPMDLSPRDAVCMANQPLKRVHGLLTPFVKHKRNIDWGDAVGLSLQGGAP